MSFKIFLKILSSVSVSTAERLSSKIRTLGFLMRALAIAILCLCPPDKLIPLSPNTESYLLLNPIISLWTFEIFENFTISS